LLSGQTINVNVSGSSYGGKLDNISSNATAIVINLKSINTSNAGYLTVYPSNYTKVPLLSNLNFFS